MKGPVPVVVYYDYLSPWCYIIAVRLQKIKEEYGAKVDIIWRGYPLVRDAIPGRRISPHSIDSRQRANLEEQNISFKPWDRRRLYPGSSVPALQAARCTRLQGEEAFQSFHMELFKAFFGESRNISLRQVLVGIAEKTGLDVGRFVSDFDGGLQKSEVLAEYEEAHEKYEGWGIPLAVVGDDYPVMGAAPTAMYRRAIDLCLTPPDR